MEELILGIVSTCLPGTDGGRLRKTLLLIHLPVSRDTNIIQRAVDLHCDGVDIRLSFGKAATRLTRFSRDKATD
jgi:hypothetical protein